MVIVLIDGKVLYPKGNIQPDVLGLLIINGDEKQLKCIRKEFD